MSSEKEMEVVERGVAEKEADRISSAVGAKASKMGQVSWGVASDLGHLVHTEQMVAVVGVVAGEGEGGAWNPLEGGS